MQALVESRLLSNSGGWADVTLSQLAKLESVRSRVLRKILESFRGEETSISEEKKIRKEAKVPPVHVLVMARRLSWLHESSDGHHLLCLHFYSGTDRYGHDRCWLISAVCVTP